MTTTDIKTETTRQGRVQVTVRERLLTGQQLTRIVAGDSTYGVFIRTSYVNHGERLDDTVSIGLDAFNAVARALGYTKESK